MQITVTFDTANSTDNKLLSAMIANLEQYMDAPVAVANDTKSRGRRAKAQTVAPEPVEVEVVEEQHTNDDQLTLDLGDEPVTYTLDDVRNALQTYTAANGVLAGVDLLKKFGAVRSSELAEEHYAAFIKECAS